MDFWDLTKLLFRRWYVAGPLLVLTLAGTFLAAKSIKPDYVATSYVQLVPPAVTPKSPDGKTAQPRNPWLDLGVSSLGKAAILTVQDQKVVKLLKSQGFSEDFTLTLDTALPIVTFEVIGSNQDQAGKTTRELIDRFDASVANLQKEYGSFKDQSISTRQLDLGDNVTESTSKVKRALVAILGVGILFTIALTITVDAILRRRAASAVAAGSPKDDEGDKATETGTNGHTVNGRGAGPAARPPVNGARPGVVVDTRDRSRTPAQRPAPSGEETAIITVGGTGDATIAIPTSLRRTRDDKEKRH